jgi:hypothetical protein
MTSVEVRRSLVEALKLDLVGPDNGSDLEEEVLNQAPSRRYLTEGVEGQVSKDLQFNTCRRFSDGLLLLLARVRAVEGSVHPWKY